MSNLLLKICDQYVADFEKAEKKTIVSKSSIYFTGIDLGTASIVLVVLDSKKNIVAGAHQPANVIRDGMVVDYIGAIHILCELKERLETQLDTQLLYAAAAIPPGTNRLDAGAIKNVVQSAGFELTALVDEPTAANTIIGLENGVIVDIGGGTTGISILKDGEVVKVADEATGGTHFSLVVSGAYQIDIDEADVYKRNSKNHKALLPILKPVVEKIAKIIKKHIDGFDVEVICLVGGTSCLTGIESIIEKEIGIKTIKPKNPMFVTPIGIAMNCSQEIIY
ncbi:MULTISPECIES: ethanolamine utilization protein EutJ [unclassified Streptococcus]|uniref:ethanolamine utilization protein EutJ n=1 Tax=unclassified Streptococcus TaxID=2608887 RepID=UPI0010725B63|nr:MULTISPECIES: ethanolamine utilization protein EutJ [unclassified Streptococcus]MBF0786420.1 ethanolamine utilization protein EutJ [Streptococcus sp. 19428wC2_LYSM12]MCQ9212527.1 ethanolamine utilization protein EutJ [Streptococcus sp. B01]MCQ9213866.1 ethanolamine utilization protein EutJ [Streptococcus sp. O1]TFV06828.1 ethanolamine utilization protein EutJ [Streptococcus sp. LYSM12]